MIKVKSRFLSDLQDFLDLKELIFKCSYPIRNVTFQQEVVDEFSLRAKRLNFQTRLKTSAGVYANCVADAISSLLVFIP